MKKLMCYCLVLFACGLGYTQSLIGAWEASMEKDGRTLRKVVIFSASHQVATSYDAETGAFVSTNGGSWFLKEHMLTETIEFDFKQQERVGTTNTFEVVLTENELKLKGADTVWKRLDDGNPGDLDGAWLISGRMRDGEIQKRDTNRPRKTMKILSGTRFQWIAYNTETKEFMGTGGGTYTTADGTYTEHIEFFSRDNARVGANLEFNYELKDGDWHHSGLSSKGKPIYEVWSLR